jgi:hypothetical protein
VTAISVTETAVRAVGWTEKHWHLASFFGGSLCEFEPCVANNSSESRSLCKEEVGLKIFPLGFQCQGGKCFAGLQCEIG